MERLSAVIICRNEADVIEECLRSLAAVADEIVPGQLIRRHLRILYL